MLHSFQKASYRISFTLRPVFMPDAVLITNDNHFNKIKKAELIEVWSNTKAIKRLLDGIEYYDDPK